MVVYDRRILDNNAMIRNNLLKKLEELNPDQDITSLIDTSLDSREALNDLKHKHPYIHIEKPPDDDIFSVSSYMHMSDRRVSGGQCEYCGESFTGKRSTRRFCSNSCRIMAFRKKKRDELKRYILYRFQLHSC